MRRYALASLLFLGCADQPNERFSSERAGADPDTYAVLMAKKPGFVTAIGERERKPAAMFVTPEDYVREHPAPKPVYVLKECGPGEACPECLARGTISVHGVDTCLELLAQENEREGTSIGVQVTTGEETPNLGVSYKDWVKEHQEAGLLETPNEGGG